MTPKPQRDDYPPSQATKRRDDALRAALSILKREFQLTTDAFQNEQLDGNMKVLASYRRNQASHSTAAARTALVGDRRWLSR